MRKISAFCVLLAAAGCGGGGSSTVVSTVPDGPPELLNYIQDQNRIGQNIVNSPATSDAGVAAQSSTVHFTGTMILDVAPGRSGAYYGDLNLTADFSTPSGSLNGSADQFVYFDDGGTSTQGVRRAGSLSLDASSLRGDNPATGAVETFAVDVNGSLDLVGFGSANVSGSAVEGAFAGPTANDVQWFAGQGTTTFDDGTSAGASFQTLILGER